MLAAASPIVQLKSQFGPEIGELTVLVSVLHLEQFSRSVVRSLLRLALSDVDVKVSSFFDFLLLRL